MDPGLANWGCLRWIDCDARFVAFDAARTGANEPGSDPTVQNQRSTQHRQYGEPLWAHYASPRISRLTRAKRTGIGRGPLSDQSVVARRMKTAGFRHFRNVLPVYNA